MFHNLVKLTLKATESTIKFLNSDCVNNALTAFIKNKVDYYIK